MFNVAGHKVILKDMHRITSNRFILFNDGDNDILYTGTNIFGNRVLGAIILEDDEQELLRYLHVIVNDDQYHKFIGKSITLRQIISENESFFIIDQGYDRKEININLISYDELPEQFRPMENSFCPDFIVEPSFTYCVSLKGNDSDLHRASPTVLNDVNTKFSKFLETSTEFIEELDINRTVFIQANQIGSFEIKFNIDLSQSSQLSIYNISQDKINEFLNGLYHYMFYTLPKEKEDVFKRETIESDEFKIIENKLIDIYDSVKLKPQAGVEQKVIDIINYSLLNLKEIDYSVGFNRIEFSNISPKGETVPIGFLNESYIPSVQYKLFKLEESLKEAIIVLDDHPKEYKIQVYLFNIQTGFGSAMVLDVGDKLDRINLHVQGKESYDHTVFTHSMDEGIIVEIVGIAKRVNSRITEISVDMNYKPNNSTIKQ